MALSTHPGGAADKAGHIHEALWGVRAFLAVLNGEASSVRIETPGDQGAEFYLLRGTVREHWQAKRQVTGQDTWSFQKLKSEGVLTYFFEKFRLGERCAFASVSDAPELRMLTENATASTTFAEFKERFLDKKRSITFAELRGHLGSPTEHETYDFLRSFTIHGGREITLESILGCALGATFQGPWQNTMAVLRDLYLRSAHEMLTAADIEQHLQYCGIARRRAAAPDARERILASTRTYVAGQRAKLIRGTAIKRAVANDIIANFQNGTAPLDILIASTAGGGKSACLCQIIEGLQATGVPVLAFRLDRVEPVATAIELGEKLGLGESPALVLADNYPGQRVVLVVDQLDCVSTTSGRHPDFFDTIAALRDEIIGLRSRTTIHLVMACRKFDFEHDHRLKQLLEKGQTPITLGELSDEEVKSVLMDEGGDVSRLTAHQRAMLRLPQNLSLFVGAKLALAENHFSTAKELCDAYWDAKRKAVTANRPDFDHQWQAGIKHLATTMSDRQELSVPASVMDSFAPEFLARMASEGVLTWDGRRYGFGHESFFDYCFARTQTNGGRDFVRILENDAQHLFRRAQLRQVLAFLRDDDFPAYLESISQLLKSDGIRPHLKLLVIELVAAHPESRDDEFLILLPWIESEFNCGRSGQLNPDSLASRIFDAFSASRTLFLVADRLHFTHQWLNSHESWMVDTMCLYFRCQSERHAERVAELLEPFVGKAEWKKRLRYVMEGRSLGKSRRYFDLFLRLVDDGTLDDAKDRFVSNGTFWSMLHGFAEERPDWCAELAAHWLGRQIAIARSANDSQESPYYLLCDQFGVDDLFVSARRAPVAFLEHVLPTVIRAAEAFNYGDEGGLARDQVWPSWHHGEHLSMSDAFPGACETALELLGQPSPEALRPFIKQLRQQRLYTANHLLMAAYLSNPTAFADEALALLASEPERLQCGYSDSAFWLSRQIIEKCSPHCADETFGALELAVLNYVSSYERTKDGMRCRGHAAYNLAAALAPNRTSKHCRTQLAEWQEKFREPDGPPRGMRSYTVVSPIPREAARHMTDEQWLRAIAKYESSVRRYDYEHPERGGADHLASLLQDFVKEQPERFTQLALRFPENAHPTYFMNVIYGLKEAVFPIARKLEIARLAFGQKNSACLQAVLELLAETTNERLPDDAIQFVKDMARHNCSKSESVENDKNNSVEYFLSHGIYTLRGRAAATIRNLVRRDSRYLADFSETLEMLVTDLNIGVRSAVTLTLFAVAQHDTPRALRLMITLLDADDRLLGTAYVRDFLQAGLQEHLAEFAPIIERMLRSRFDDVKKQGGVLACLARLHHPANANYLAEMALSGEEPCRAGACEVAKSNLLHPEYRAWCEPTLLNLFRDNSKAVRTLAAGCFWHLWQSPDIPLTDYEPLIRSFLGSPAFVEEPTFLLHALEDTHRRVPEITLDVCEMFAVRCAAEARDIRTSLAGDEHIIGKLVFTAYAQLQSKHLTARALDVIDRMSLEGFRSAGNHLAEFER